MELSESLQAAVDLISHWPFEPETKLILDSRISGQNRYLEALDQVLQSAPCEELKDVIFMAVTQLELEFKTTLFSQTRSCHLGILAKLRAESLIGSSFTPGSSYSMTDSSSYTDSYGVDSSSYTDSIGYIGFGQGNDSMVQYLRKIAERMNSCAHLYECTSIYSEVRKPFFDEVVEGLMGPRDVKRISGEELRMETKRWIQAAKVCTYLLFVQEKEIAELIFGGLGILIAKKSFMLVVEDAALDLFSFVEMMSSSHQSPERLDIILILYDAMLSLVEDVNAVLPFESIRIRLGGILTGLQNEVNRMLSDFENALLKEKSKISTEVGNVHLLAKNVMEYVNLLVSSRKVLTSLITSKPSMTIGPLKYPDGELQDPSSLSPLSLHIVLIIAVLQLNLEAKSKKYKKASFSYMFMINNIIFIIVSIKNSRDLKKLIGTDYMKKLFYNLEHAVYELQGLMLCCLNEEDIYYSHCFCHGVSTSAFRKKVQSFNNLCEDVHVFQLSMEMANSNLWEELCESTFEKLLPAYESFLKKFEGHLKGGKDRKPSILSFQNMPINYSVEELKALFHTKSFQF